jgi:hypothetical protein
MFLSGMLPGMRAAGPELRLSPKAIRDEVRAVVEGQLAAFRTGDFAAAHDFAATGIRQQFDVRWFTLLIRRGYPALLRHRRSIWDWCVTMARASRKWS